MCILDCVCSEDASLVYRTFPYIKALFGRLSSDLSFARVLLPIAQFYLNHGADRTGIHMSSRAGAWVICSYWELEQS